MTEDEHEFELRTLGIWPEPALTRLREAWITHADQLIALAATDGGLDSIALTTSLDRRQVRDLIALTRRAMPAERVVQLETKIDTSQFGLGAEDPAKLR